MTFSEIQAADSSEFPTAAPPAADNISPYRPIQYLGNKLRAISEILGAAEALIGKRGSVADLFTGTTVVAQAFARHGYTVTAADTQQYATVFASALLGIGRKRGESCASSDILRLGVTASSGNLTAPWSLLVEREDQAIRGRDITALSALAAQLPLIWRDPLHPLYRHIEVSDRRSALGESLIITSIYAGSYFSVRQALAIDGLRQSAGIALQKGALSEWQYCAVLTAIMAAASAASHSAGKHFAQPLNAGTLNNRSFLHSRLLQDRSISIEQEFMNACDAVNIHSRATFEGHSLWCGSAEDYMTTSAGADLYYLDPPYTAQQYSRFYHVLETICNYDYPQLIENGRITTGLYPAKRYKSAFSSKRLAPGAFRSIVSAARAYNAALLISYSQSATGSDGNARMISLEDLLDICCESFGSSNVDTVQLGHRYRQFNSTTASNIRRDDPEILITCRPH